MLPNLGRTRGTPPNRTRPRLCDAALTLFGPRRMGSTGSVKPCFAGIDGGVGALSRGFGLP